MPKPMPNQHLGADFKACMNFVFAAEGGFVADPDDRGGPTNMGISLTAHPNESIASLTKARALEIYEHDYFLPSGAAYLPYPLSLIVLDYAVHSGILRPVRTLQGLVSATRDGKFGPETLALCQKYLATPAGIYGLANKILMMRAIYLDRLCQSSEFYKFQKGWENRLAKLKTILEDWRDTWDETRIAPVAEGTQ